jgi:hypothetical protein
MLLGTFATLESASPFISSFIGSIAISASEQVSAVRVAPK